MILPVLPVYRKCNLLCGRPDFLRVSVLKDFTCGKIIVRVWACVCTHYTLKERRRNFVSGFVVSCALIPLRERDTEQRFKRVRIISDQAVGRALCALLTTRRTSVCMTQWKWWAGTTKGDHFQQCSFSDNINKSSVFQLYYSLTYSREKALRLQTYK